MDLDGSGIEIMGLDGYGWAVSGSDPIDFGRNYSLPLQFGVSGASSASGVTGLGLAGRHHQLNGTRTHRTIRL